jgi:hypothetical protein
MTGLQNCCGKEPLLIVMNLLRSGGEPRRIGPLPERLHGSVEAVNWWGGWRAAVSPPQPVVDGAEKRPEMIHHEASLQAASAPWSASCSRSAPLPLLRCAG